MASMSRLARVGLVALWASASATSHVMAAAAVSPSTTACSDQADEDACIAAHARDAHEALANHFTDQGSKVAAVCSEFSGSEATACLEHANTLADADLDAAYAAAISATDDGDDPVGWRARLKDSQDAWLAYRDADCGDLVVTEFRGGAGAEPALEACKLGKTEARAADLRSRYGRH